MAFGFSMLCALPVFWCAKSSSKKLNKVGRVMRFPDTGTLFQIVMGQLISLPSLFCYEL